MVGGVGGHIVRFEKNNIIFYGSGRVKNDIRKIKLKGSDRLWIRPVLKDERGVKKRERERIEAAKVSVKERADV